MNIFINWVKEIIKEKSKDKYKIITIDGKVIKSTTDKVNNGNIPYIVSAFLEELGLSMVR